MEIQKYSYEPQPSNNERKQLTYPNLADFIKKTRDLLKEQQKYQIDLFNQMTQNKTMQQIQQQGCGLSNMLIVGQRQGFYGKVILTLIKQYHSEKNPMLIPQQCKLQVGDDVAIMRNNSQLASGVVYKRTGPKIKISIRQQDHEEQHDYEGLNCHLVLKWNEVTFRRYFNILQDLEQYTVYKRSQLIDKLFPQSYELNQKSRSHHLTVTKEDQQSMPTMNQEQIRAIKTGLKQQVHLIHGPPGTGKTTTVCELIVQAVKKGEKVLACAPSNIAVDNIVESIGNKVKCVRIGNPARVIESILSHCLDSLITSHTNQWKTEVKKLQATRKRLSKTTSRQEKRKLYFEIKSFQSEIHLLQQQVIEQILNEADVICATNVGAADRIFRKYLAKRKFDLVVIDQCGQGLQISCWIPLLKAKRAVLAGDHKQLPPTVKGSQNSALSYTLFSRAMDELTNITSTMLLVQYRMNNLIMGWSNKMFYNDKLVAHDSVKDHLLRQLYKNVQENEEVVMMVDTTGCKMGQSGQEKESKMNVGEADISIAIYKKILAYGVEAKHIAILTPYSKQVALIRSLLQEQNLPLADVSTVDGIQGRQKECIIISLVRSNKKKQIGFLKDWRRMNVAVTRARRMLVLIGNSDCVSKDQYIGTLVKWIQEHGRVVSALEFEGDSMVRFGEGVQDGEQFGDGNNKTAQDKNKNKKKKKKPTQQIPAIQKPSIYQAHTQDQIQNLKQYYKAVFQQVKDQVVFPGATNFQRKLIHEVAESMGLNHETSQDKKQIKVWLKEPEIIEVQLPQEEKMIEIKGKPKSKVLKQKELQDNEKLLTQKIEQNKLKNVSGGKFGDALQSLMGQDESSSEDQKQVKQEKPTQQEQKAQEKQELPKPKAKKNKKQPKPQPASTQATAAEQQDYDAFFSQFQKSVPKKDECYKCSKKITSVTSVTCRFCTISFCRNHVLAEEHGCDEAAKNEARGNHRQIDRLCELGADKIKQKIKEQQDARKRKGKDEKQKKK